MSPARRRSVTLPSGPKKHCLFTAIDDFTRNLVGVEAEPQRRVRRETYDEDLGQLGWIEAAEVRDYEGKVAAAGLPA